MDTSRLLALTPELLDEVISFVNCGTKTTHAQVCRISTLTALCATSKTLYHTTLPFLYSRYDYTSHGKNVDLFVRTLCEQPNLVKYLRHISTSWLPASDHTTAGLPVSVQSALVEFENDAGFDKYLNALWAGSRAAYMGLLLALAQDVHALTIDLHDFRSNEGGFYLEEEPDMDFVLNFILSSPRMSRLPSTAYRHLSRVRVQGRTSYPDDDEGSDPSVLSCIMRLPHLLTLKASSMSSFASSDSVWTGEAAYSSVTSIILSRRNNPSTNAVAGLIKSSRALEQFELELKYLENRDPDQPGSVQPTPFTLDGVQSALDSHVKSLRRLKITNPDAFEVEESLTQNRLRWPGWIWRGQGHLKVQHFSALRHLEVDQGVLLGFRSWPKINMNDVLPPHLRTLTLNNEGGLRRFPETLACFATFSAPKLRKLTLTFTARDEVPDDMWLLCIRNADALPDGRQWHLGDRHRGENDEPRPFLCMWSKNYDQKPISAVCCDLESIIREKGIFGFLAMQLPSAGSFRHDMDVASMENDEKLQKQLEQTRESLRIQNLLN